MRLAPIFQARIRTLRSEGSSCRSWQKASTPAHQHTGQAPGIAGASKYAGAKPTFWPYDIVLCLVLAKQDIWL